MAEILLIEKAMNSETHSVGRTESEPKSAFSLILSSTLDIERELS